MPYQIFRDGDRFCVHKLKPNGERGEQIGCHDTRGKAEAQQRALYAGEASLLTKSTDDGYAVLIPLTNDPDLKRLQDALRMAYGEGEWNDPATFHVTLAYGTGHPTTGGSFEVSNAVRYSGLVVDGIGTFDTPDGHTIHLTVKQSIDLLGMHIEARAYLERLGLTLSEHYQNPNDFNPHITLGYVPQPVAGTGPIEPLVLAARDLHFTGPDHAPISTVQLKTAADPAVRVYSPPARPTRLQRLQRRKAFRDLAARGFALGGTVFRKEDGRRYMLLVSSNGYQDREGEIITTAALRRYVEKSWLTDDRCITHNVLMFWHDGDPIGDIMWCDMEGPFLIEVARELPNQDIVLSYDADGAPQRYSTVKAVWDALETNPLDLKWGASVGFESTAREARKGEYRTFYKFETSVLPLAAAANSFTASEVVT